MPALPLILAAGPALVAPAPLPDWWRAFLALPGFSARFTQESESAVFGTLRRGGTLAAARGGRLRAAYDRGLVLVADGLDLVQYDPDTRTAQRWNLREARGEAPLLALLMDPASAPKHFSLEPAAGGGLKLRPRTKDLPEVELEGQGALPTRLRWTDASGARQVLRLESPRAGVPAGESFRFQAPAGTRWVGGR